METLRPLRVVHSDSQPQHNSHVVTPEALSKGSIAAQASSAWISGEDGCRNGRTPQRRLAKLLPPVQAQHSPGLRRKTCRCCCIYTGKRVVRRCAGLGRCRAGLGEADDAIKAVHPGKSRSYRSETHALS